ncbi:hypothetical protein E3P99_00336 [Wallemia hederae]|uniref:Uncharacterized protein n=1 Tax=Wallemia hederae TaxID=1540922 RepID=A0A4T0FWS9_9BASI|nr:hypothetical protein E3P99_00336 [Wallemia hederae]
MFTRFVVRQSAHTRRFATSRSVLSTLDDGQSKQDPTKIDQERKRQDEAGNKNAHGEDVSPHSEGAPGWNPTLATGSEEAAKADRDPHATPENLAKNANKTAEKVNKDTGNV